MHTQANKVVKTRVTVAVIVFVLFNLFAASFAQATEREKETIQPISSKYAEEATGPQINIEFVGPLKKYVKSHLASIQHRLGNQWILDHSSLECASKEIREQQAGACIINAKLFNNKDTVAMWAILVGENDENGGIAVRKIEFLKQSN